MEAFPRRADGYHPLATDANAQATTMHRQNLGAAYRTIMPFFLMIGVVLLLVWRFIVAPTVVDPKPLCGEGQLQYLVQPGDSCWEISRAHGLPLEELQRLNSEVHCDKLLPGTALCLPQPPKHS
ncbi:hypothetical protein HGRIS_008716 [Hohenbuehelia grisea]|uniref:LysM domain-containing protein n=1 Tax=Hohenbuehelia grisea TaxID=104357 RepID=A0ABR3J9C3_9AGAR